MKYGEKSFFCSKIFIYGEKATLSSGTYSLNGYEQVGWKYVNRRNEFTNFGLIRQVDSNKFDVPLSTANPVELDALYKSVNYDVVFDGNVGLDVPINMLGFIVTLA